jgi:hypothetical protein
MKLPQHLKPLFWSYDFEALDTATMPKLIVSQVVQYGTMADWQWLITVYGKSEVEKILKEVPPATFRPKLQPLVQTVFSA